MVEPQGWHRRGDQLITMAAGWGAAVSALMVLAMIGGSWAASFALGGSNTVGPQLFHIPTVLAATRFGARGAALVALISGVVCGPLLPLYTDPRTPQSFGNWFSRLVIFLVVGQIVAALLSRSVADAGRRIHDHHVVHELQAAVGRGEFVPAYQPIVDLHTGAIVGVEALARWCRADGSVAPPSTFIPDAERTGVIDDIDRAIFAQACRQLVAWTSEGLADPGLRLSVNLSVRHLADPALAPTLAAVLAETGFPAERLILEITETSLLDDPAGAAWRLSELRALGLSISLDDFGVGLSSLGNLARFPIDAYKIDRSFILGAESDRGRALVGSVIHLARAMGLAPPVAEGIETESQLEVLVSLGCTKGQGFLFAGPSLAPEVADVLARGEVALPSVR